jgi:GT2 family glycosyltransferase
MAHVNQVRVTAVLTCHNRREKTRAALSSLQAAAASLGEGLRLRVIVTDDGSADGTAEMLQSCFPDVEVLQGDGQLFWAGGMRRAFGRALEHGFDHCLWLNDDTELFVDALAGLLRTHEAIVRATGRPGIVVGTTCDARGRVTYGGLRRRGCWLGVLKFDRIEPAATPLPCDTLNGNCVLVSSEAAVTLGNLDTAFRHGMADFDYGLRAHASGIAVWTMPGFAGRCEHDHAAAGSFRDPTLSLARRWKLLVSPKGVPPRGWAVLCWRHAGPLWPLHFVWPFVRTVLSSARYRIIPLHRRGSNG